MRFIRTMLRINELGEVSLFPQRLYHTKHLLEMLCVTIKKNNKITIIKKTLIAAVDKTNYIPVGIVVVPGSHNVYGDGSCGVMSLKEMS